MMQRQLRTRVLVDIDNAVVNAGIELLLGDFPQLEVVQWEADVVVVNGLRQRRLIPASAVLLAPPAPTDELLHAAATTGVRAIVTADEPVETVVQAIRAVHVGCGWTSGPIGGRLLTLCARPAGTPDHALPRCGLTPREQQVLERVADGMSNTEIAAGLVVTVRTVKHHVSNVLLKLGARDRAHAVALAYRFNITKPAAAPNGSLDRTAAGSVPQVIVSSRHRVREFHQ